MPAPLSIDNIKEKIKLKFPHEDLDLANIVMNGNYVENIICNKCNSKIRKSKHALNVNENICNNCLQKKFLTPIEIVKQRLKIMNFELLGDYIGNKYKTKIKCLKCNTIFNKGIEHIFNGGKCTVCNSITNEIIDDRIKDRSFKRLGEYISSRIKIEWECLKCKQKWKATPNNIFKGKGCPKCANVLPLNNEIIDERIKDRPFKRIGNYSNSHIKIEWECFKCGNHWNANCSNILNGKGCPRCRMSKGEMLIKSYLKQNNVKYEVQKTFDDCIMIGHMFYDFYLPDCNLMIEYQGKQHYEPVSYFGGMKDFISTCVRDQFKKDYCKSHNFYLLEIPYWDIKNINQILKTTLHL